METRENAGGTLSEIRRSLALLEWGPDVCAELRCLGNREIGMRHATVSGYFADLERMAQTAAYWSGKARGVYAVLNPLARRVLHRAANGVLLFAPKNYCSQDDDVLRRRWLAVDLDPVRPTGLAATDAEHAAAIERARAVREHLRGLGLCGLVLGSSGNGAYVLLPFPRPNDEENRVCARGILENLAEQFDDERVVVDTTMFNAARLVRVFGTLNCKGDHHPEENPHRLAAILEVDE